MKFTLLEVNLDQEQKSDYETALDMSYITITGCNAGLKAEMVEMACRHLKMR